MNKKEQAAYDAAMKICRKGCIGNFANCNRCHEPTNGFPTCKIMRIGNLETCPVEKYNIPDQPKFKDIFEAMKNSPTIKDCNSICLNCDECTKDEEYLHFSDNCYDCPVFVVRECIQENEAEARMS